MELKIHTFTKKNLWMRVHSIIHNSQKSGNRPRVQALINKMWHIHTMEYCSSVKRNEVLMHDTTCMNLESIMLSEKRQSQCNILLYEKTRKSKSMEWRSSGCLGFWRGGRGLEENCKLLLMGTGFLVSFESSDSLKIDCGCYCLDLWIYWKPLNCIL